MTLHIVYCYVFFWREFCFFLLYFIWFTKRLASFLFDDFDVFICSLHHHDLVLGISELYYSIGQESQQNVDWVRMIGQNREYLFDTSFIPLRYVYSNQPKRHAYNKQTIASRTVGRYGKVKLIHTRFDLIEAWLPNCNFRAFVGDELLNDIFSPF